MVRSGSATEKQKQDLAIELVPSFCYTEEEIRRFAAALEDVIVAAERYPAALVRLGLRALPRAAGVRR